MLLEKFRKAAKAVLQQGLTPEQLGLTICLAGAVGTLPIVWGTSVLCVGLAARYRLNQAAMQAVNYLVYPLQIALFFPFFKLGQRFLPWGPSASPELLRAALHGELSAFSLFFFATVKAVAVWLVTVPPLSLLLYPRLVATFRRRKPAANPGEA